MKRRAVEFVHASPRMSPDQIQTVPRLRDDRTRTTGEGVRDKAARGAARGCGRGVVTGRTLGAGRTRGRREGPP